MNIQNLKESVIDIAKRGELNRIRNVTPDIEAFVSEFIESEAV